MLEEFAWDKEEVDRVYLERPAEDNLSGEDSGEEGGADIRGHSQFAVEVKEIRNRIKTLRNRRQKKKLSLHGKEPEHDKPMIQCFPEANYTDCQKLINNPKKCFTKKYSNYYVTKQTNMLCCKELLTQASVRTNILAY